LTRYFAYDEAGHLIGEYDEAGDPIQETVWLGDIPVATLKPNVGGGVSVFYIHTDNLNTPRRITRPSDNAILWRWDSAPFGATAANDDPDGDTITFAFNLRFPGQYFDAETGLHYNYFRDYDPVTGRYLQSDPLGLVAGINTYAYVGGNPLSFTDSTGQYIETAADVGFIAWDLWRLLRDNLLRDCDNLGENLAALGADAAGTLIPGVTGLGLGVRAARRAEQAAAAARRAEEALAAARRAEEAAGSASPMLFRGMKNADGLPAVGPTARTLGVRPRSDIPVDGVGMVRPNTGGMSVAPSPGALPPHRRPPEFGGTGKDPVWGIRADQLGPDLRYVPDGPTHGTIQPSRAMTIDEFQRALCSTGVCWVMQ
jgi:RHS repeat-associated protein